MSTIVKEDFLENLESSGLIIPYSHLRLLDCVGQGMYYTHMTISLYHIVLQENLVLYIKLIYLINKEYLLM